MNHNPPVTDWVNDFDHTDPQWTENPFPIWDDLRSKCPVVHTERFLGVYLPTTYEAVKQIAYDTEHFSSRRVVVRNARPEITMPSPHAAVDAKPFFNGDHVRQGSAPPSRVKFAQRIVQQTGYSHKSKACRKRHGCWTERATLCAAVRSARLRDQAEGTSPAPVDRSFPARPA